MRSFLIRLALSLIVALALSTLAVAQGLFLQTRDGLGLQFGTDGRVAGASLDGKALPGDGPGGFTVTDVVAGGKSTPIVGTVEKSPDGAQFTGKAEEADVGLTVAYEAAPAFIRAHCTVRDLTGGDRGIVVQFALPLDAVGGRWWQDVQSTQSIEPNKVYEDASGVRAFPGIAEYMGQAGLDIGRHSRLFACAVTPGPPGAGLSLAVPLDEFRIFRTGYDAAKKRLYIAFDLALCKETKVTSESSFTFLIQRVDPRWGLRDALSRYYAAYPQFFEKAIFGRTPPQREGVWMPFENLENIDNCNEFGFGVQEGCNNPEYDDALGVDSLPYYGGGSEMWWVPNYKPGKDPVPSYDVLVKLFNELLDKRFGTKEGFTEAGTWDKNGKLSYGDAAPYGHFGSQMDSNPAYQYGQALLRNMDKTFESWAQKGGHVDGVYYDGLAAGLDYNRAHFKDASFPPIWDPAAKKPVLYNYFSSLDFACAASKQLHAEGRVAMTNGAMSSDMFGAPYLDYMGEETGLVIPRSGFNFVRAICYRKTFMTLLKGDYTKYTHADIERYMQRCVAYGCFPGFFDWYTSGLGPGSSYWVHPEQYNRDRDLFRKYIPLARWVAKAGWEPLTLAECDNPRVYVERWGRAADSNLAFTLLSESAGPESGTLTLPKALGLAGSDLIAFDQISGRKLDIIAAGAGSLVRFTLPAEGFGLVQIMPRKAFIASQAQMIKDVIGAGETQARLDALRQRPAVPKCWVPNWGVKGYTGSIGRRDEAHSGGYSLAFDHAKDTKRRNTVYTWVNMHQKQPQAFTISAWSRAEGVDGKKDDNYALKIVTCHVTNYTEYTPQSLQFDPGSHDWQQVSVTIRPTETIDAVQLMPIFQFHAGKVWFDDITLTTEDGKQWVYDPGFEEWDCRPQAGQEVPQGLPAVSACADALLAGSEPLAQLSKIQTALLFPGQQDEIRTLPSQFERQDRDLADAGRIAGLTVAGLYHLPTLTLAAQSRVVSGDEVSVTMKLEGKSDLKLDPPVYSLNVLGKWQQIGKSTKGTVRVPKDAALGQELPVRARAQMWADRKILLTMEASAILKVAPRAAGDLQLVDVADNGTTFVASAAVQNNGNSAVDCGLQPILPPGWTATGPTTLKAAAHEDAAARFAFKAPDDAAMGRYTFTVRVTVLGEKPFDRSVAAWFVPAKANRIVNPGFEDNDGKLAKGWSKVEGGYEIAAGAHEGKSCIRVANTEDAQVHEATQGIALNQKTPTPIVVRAFSKCENVPGSPDAGYAVYLDCYYQGGGALYGQTLTFDTGTHGWQCLERVIEPAKPIASISVYAFLRNRRGTVYFDDTTVAEDEAQKGNVALASLGTKVATDSNYTEYTPAPLTDGVTDTTGLDWRVAAWASADEAKEHWIELTFPQPTQVQRVAIYWNNENKVIYTSRDCQVQAWVDGAWKTVAVVQGQAVMPVSTHSFAPVTTTKLRILQAVGGGLAERQNVMWVSEVKVF